MGNSVKAKKRRARQDQKFRDLLDRFRIGDGEKPSHLVPSSDEVRLLKRKEKKKGVT